jgi:hypothetical protein
LSVLSTITRAFQRYGQPISIQTSGAFRTVTGLVVPMDSGTQGVFFDGNETVGLFKPALTLFVAGSEPNPPKSQDIFLYPYLDAPGHGNVIVQKVFAYCLSGQVVVYECLCDG